MKGVLLAAVAVALSSGAAAAGPTSSGPTLSFTLAADVSDYDSFVGPLGGGICLGGARVTDPKADGGVSWTPDGRRFAFFRQTGTLTADVFVADANGGHLTNVTRGGSKFSWAPDWSPDGARIVYVASDRDVEQLVTIRPDGSDPRGVPGTATDPNAQLRGPRWAPDGDFIGYTRSGDIHVIRPDGSGDRVVLPNASGLAWSPNGRRMAFTRDGDLALADSDGSNVVLVTHTPNAIEANAAFSPDGSKLVYTSLDNAPRGEQGPGDHMYLTDAEGGDRREIYGPRRAGGWGPAWRPAAPAPRGTRPCVLRGTKHDDVLVGTPKGDLIYARGGNDIVRGRGGDDIIVGDVPFAAHPGKDRLFGGPGRDFIDSYDGRRDVVDGGAERDRGMDDRHDRVRSIETQG
jgi:hypothetical protein